MSILSLDRAQLLDHRGNPVVNATIYIGDGNRDPEIFPKLAYADQDRTSTLGSTLTTDSYGRFPKAYIEPPYSYRIRLEDGSQVDEQLFSFGIVEIDYTPGGTGTEAINVGATGDLVGLDMLDQQVTDLLNQVGINSSDISAEVSGRAAALTQEAATRAQEIAAEAAARANGDTSIQGNVDALTTSVSANADGLTAQDTRIVAVESSQNDIYGDGTNIGLNAFATDYQNTKAAVENSATGLAATRTLATTTESRLNDTVGDASGKTIEQLSADLTQLQSDVATGVSGAASVQSVNDVNTRVDGTESSITSLGSQLTTVSTEAANAQSNANSAVSTANAAQSTANAAQNTANSTATSLSTVQSDVSGIQSSVTTQSSAITALQNDVATQEAAFAVVANAGDSTAAIEVTANGGTGSQVLLKADRVVADRGSGPESLFDADGLLDEVFSRRKYTFLDHSAGDTPYPASGFLVLNSLTQTLPPGTYSFDFLINAATTFTSGIDGEFTVNLAISPARMALSSTSINSVLGGNFPNADIFSSSFSLNQLNQVSGAAINIASVRTVSAGQFIYMRPSGIITLLDEATITVRSSGPSDSSVRAGAWFITEKIN